MNRSWEIQRLGRLLLGSPRYGINAAAAPAGSGGRTYIRITDIDESGRFTPSPKVEVLHPAAESYLLEPGHIVFARTGASVGKSYLYDPADGELVFAGFLINVEPDPRRLNPRYLAAYVQTRAYWNWVGSTSMRSGQPGINGREYADMPLPTPPIEIQDGIAEIARACDEHIRQIERMIAKKQAIRQGLMQQLLTARTRLPGFTGKWSDVLLGDAVSYLKTVPLSRAQLDASSPLRCLHYGDIHTSDATTLDAARAPMPRAHASMARGAGRLAVGDVVFADASEDPAGVGKSVEITSVPAGGVVPGLHTIAARFDKSVLADGFKAYLQFIPTFRASLLRLAAGAKVLATTRTQISSVELSLPEVDEQRRIAAVLRDSDHEIDALAERLRKAQAIKQGMMQQLLTGPARLSLAEAVV